MRFLLISLLGLLCTGFVKAKVLPVLNNPASVDVVLGDADTTIDLDTVFGTEAVDDTTVRFSSNFLDVSTGQQLHIDIALFSNRTPLSRANFLNYVNDGDYIDSLLHRSVPGFILQGGTYEYDSTTDSFMNVPLDSPVPNEFGISNTSRTVAIPKKANQPDSGTSGWFINVAENGPKLDGQNGGFTVFGRVTNSTYSTAKLFESSLNFSVWDFSSVFGEDFDEFPVFVNYAPPGFPDWDSEAISFPSVSFVPLSPADAGNDTTLTYEVAGNNNPGLISTSINGDVLTVTPAPDLTGSGLFAVRATDSVGNEVLNIIDVTVSDTYARWRAANYSGPDLFDDDVSGPTADPNRDGISNLELFATHHSVADGRLDSLVSFTNFEAPDGSHRARFTVPRRQNVPVTFFIEKSEDLKIWNTAPARVITTSDGDKDDVFVRVIEVIDPVSYPSHYRVCWKLAGP